MTMKFTQLTTYWDAGDAIKVLEFLDELHELLWKTYLDDIVEMELAASDTNLYDDASLDQDLNDDIPF